MTKQQIKDRLKLLIEQTIIDGQPMEINLPNNPIMLFLIQKIAILELGNEHLEQQIFVLKNNMDEMKNSLNALHQRN